MHASKVNSVDNTQQLKCTWIHLTHLNNHCMPQRSTVLTTLSNTRIHLIHLKGQCWQHSYFKNNLKSSSSKLFEKGIILHGIWWKDLIKFVKIRNSGFQHHLQLLSVLSENRQSHIFDNSSFDKYLSQKGRSYVNFLTI